MKTTALHWSLNLGALVLLLGCGVTTFVPIFGLRAALLTAGVGSVVGLVIGSVSAWRRCGTLLTLLVTVVAYYLFGGACALPTTTIAGFIPSLETLIQLTVMAAHSWRDLLTVTPPVTAFVGPAVMPWLSALVISTLAARVALSHSKFWGFAIPATGLQLVLGIAFGTHFAPFATIIGCVFFVVAMGWASLRQFLSKKEAASDIVFDRKSGQKSSIAHIVFGLLLLCLVMGLAASIAPLMTASDRYVLRKDVIPPVDLRPYASPLTAYRYMEREQKETTLFTISELPKDARIRLATLDSYDGWVYSAERQAARFMRVGDHYDLSSTVTGRAATATITIGDLTGGWMPSAETLLSIDMGQKDAKNARAVYLNQDTGCLLTTDDVKKGQSYELGVTWTIPKKPDKIGPAAVSRVDQPENKRVPVAVSALIEHEIKSIGTPLERAQRIETFLKQQGFYSNGSDGKSRAGHSTDRIGTMLSMEQIIGDDEQYAVAMALMVRSMGIPARVVMGFYPDEAKRPSSNVPLAVTGEMAHVWVEIPFEGVGWVTFDPTPGHERVPNKAPNTPRKNPQPQVQPPHMPPKEEAVPPSDIDSDKVPRPDPKSTLWLEILAQIAMYSGLALLLLSPILVIFIAKIVRRIRRRRRPTSAGRIAGGWAEVVDTARDLGNKIDPRQTRQEIAGQLLPLYPQADVAAIADVADHATFGPDKPSVESAQSLWQSVEVTVRQMRQAAGARKAILSRFALRSFLRNPR